MRNRYHSDNGADCWRCGGSIYTYTVDDCVTYVGACCISCGADNMFYPPRTLEDLPLDTPSNVSTAHREAAGRVMHGRTCYPGGRQIEVISPYPDWTQWAVAVLNKAAEHDEVKS